MKKILLPVDSGELCPKMMGYIQDYAKHFGAEVHVIHIVHQHEYGIDPYTEAHYHQMSNVYEIHYTLGEEYVSEVAKKVNEVTDKVTTSVIKGNVSHEICQYAEEHGMDFIMMCSHRYNVIQRFLLGSTTSKVVHHASVPVFVIR